ncbi:autoinducer binding domain-containing protein [Bordetella petrii]|uniref:autoinducer binding domain-containing protein n=1 Tax=Bordetella petrii TaxID=94624 RepID=UPI0012DDD0B5|nr:autoinducer binding domain-containing protein [Bordetella petrii]
MENWWGDVLTPVTQADTAEEIFDILRAAAHHLGFDYCAYGLRLPTPFTNPRIYMINNYPEEWQRKYGQAGYLTSDPTVLHAQRSQLPFVWDESLYQNSRPFWEEARAHGLTVGWAQSALDGMGTGGLLTLARSHEPITRAELEAKELRMSRLLNIAHESLSRIYIRREFSLGEVKLTPREREILCWYADGKTAVEISEILLISLDTVKFHTKNVLSKLQTPNKTSAVLRAAMLGLLR